MAGSRWVRRRASPLAVAWVAIFSHAGTARAQATPAPADTLVAAMERSRSAGDSAALAEAHNAYGLLHWNAARYDSAVAHLEEARVLWNALHDSVGLGRVNNNLGAAHYQWGNLGPALEAFLQSMAVRRALGDSRGVALAQSNIGLAYRDWGQHERARLALEEAVATADEAGEPFVRGYARNNLGLALLAAGDLRGARAAFEESLAIYQDPESRLSPVQVRSGWGLNVHGLARVHLAEGDPQRAVEILEELFGGTPEEARTGRQAQALVDLGQAYHATGSTARAVGILELALELSRQSGHRPLTVDVLAALSRVHEARGDLVSALAFLRSHDSLRDSLMTQSGAQQIANLELRSNAELQANENRSLREEQRAQEAVIARQRLAFLLGGGLLGMALLFAATLIHFNRQERARQRTLSAANQMLEEANRELRSAMAEVRTLSGLIPICAKCKKVRDDRGYWESVESYISSRSDALFSHGICNECGPQLYGDAWGEPEEHATVSGPATTSAGGEAGEGPPEGAER